MFYRGHGECCPKQAGGSSQPFFLKKYFVTVVRGVDLTNVPLLEQTEGSSETTEKLKKGISGFLGVISETLAPPPDKTIDCDVITLMATPTGTTEVYDSSKVTLLIAADV